MGPRRTDLLSESVDAASGWLRWPLRGSVVVLKAGRILIALQAVGGAIGVVVGTVTLNGALVAVGLGQLALAGVVLGLSLGSEQVIETTGAAGSFVVRSGAHRRWRDKRGLARVVPFVMGHRTWRASVRRRAEDPFGERITTVEVATEREAVAAAQALAARIRAGEDLSPLSGPPAPQR